MKDYRLELLAELSGLRCPGLRVPGQAQRRGPMEQMVEELVTDDLGSFEWHLQDRRDFVGCNLRAVRIDALEQEERKEDGCQLHAGLFRRHQSCLQLDQLLPVCHPARIIGRVGQDMPTDVGDFLLAARDEADSFIQEGLRLVP